MKLIDFLKMMDKDTFIFLGISVCGMQFETRHSVEFFMDNGDELNSRKIMKVYILDDGLHIRLED
ncbi:MAG: hypothetical protein ACLUCA_11260 [Mediterraneibacter gnavus]